jgi:8-oxo-dGTP diphosphatase
MPQILDLEIQNKSLHRFRAYTPAISRVQLKSSSPEQKQKPRLGCAGLIRRGDQVLLGKRNKEPNRGLWVLPGGGVEFGESFAKTLERELLEEAGIQVEAQGVFNVYELINPPNEHRVIVYINANYRSGDPVASSDLSEVRFFDSNELQKMSQQKLISPFVERVLREATLL